MTDRPTPLLHLAPTDAATVARIAATYLDRATAAAGRVLVLVGDPALATAVARPLAAGGAVATLTAAARAARVLAATAPDAMIATPEVARDLIARSAFPGATVRAVVLVGPDALATDALDVVLAEVPDDAIRVAIAPGETPTLEEFAARHLHRARRVRTEDATPVPGDQPLFWLSATGSQRWTRLAAALDEIDPATVVVVAANAADAADATEALTALGLGTGGPLAHVVTDGALPARPALVVVSALPDRATLARVLAAHPEQVLVMGAARDLPLLRLASGGRRVRTLQLDGARAQAAAREAAVRAELRAVLAAGGHAKALLTLGPLFEDADPAEVAAAALVLLDRAREVAPRPAASVAPRDPRPARDARPARESRPRRDDDARPPRRDRDDDRPARGERDDDRPAARPPFRGRSGARPTGGKPFRGRDGDRPTGRPAFRQRDDDRPAGRKPFRSRDDDRGPRGPRRPRP
jgi:hypothetical protein